MNTILLGSMSAWGTGASLVQLGVDYKLETNKKQWTLFVETHDLTQGAICNQGAYFSKYYGMMLFYDKVGEFIETIPD